MFGTHTRQRAYRLANSIKKREEDEMATKAPQPVAEQPKPPEPIIVKYATSAPFRRR